MNKQQFAHLSGLLSIAVAQIALVWADPTTDLYGKIAISAVTLITVFITDRTKQERVKIILRTLACVAAAAIASVISSASLGTGAVAVLTVLAAVFVRLQGMLPAPKVEPNIQGGTA